jgi:hypothetical protein
MFEAWKWMSMPFDVCTCVLLLTVYQEFKEMLEEARQAEEHALEGVHPRGPEQRFKLSTLFLKMLPEAMQPPRARAHLTVFWSRVVYDRLRLANIPRVCTLLCGPSLSAYSDASFTLSASGAASSDS